MRKYLKVWFLMSMNSFQSFFISRVSASLFLLGKILRFLFFLGFLVILVNKTKVLAGYNIWEVSLFYLTFNLIDSITQMLFRDVYRFRQLILTGSFDLLLVKPMNSLFRVLFGGTDLLDLITLFPFIFSIIFIMTKISTITYTGVIFYIILLINSMLIATSFHIMVMALAVLTSEIDHAIMIYRDFATMGRIPIDIYQEPFRSLVTFIIPVGIMMSFPVKALIGSLYFNTLVSSLITGIGLFLISLTVWNFALRRYTSAAG